MKQYNIPDTLYIIRILNGNTQSQIAEKAGLSQDYISCIESGKRKPTIDTLEKLLGAYGINFSDFFAVAENYVNIGKTDKKFLIKLLKFQDKETKLLIDINKMITKLGAANKNLN
jgi:transcriptional regulator with XRE-family HTH domain